MPVLEIDTPDRDQLVAELTAIHEKLHASLKPVYEQISERMATAVRASLQSGSFAPLSPVTLEIRARRGGGGSTPLSASGKMAGSVTARATEKAAIARIGWPALAHQEGYVTSPKSAIPNKVVPARPFAVLGDDVIEGAFTLIEEHYFGG